MMDAAPLYATNYFPARSLFGASLGGAGHWRVARRDPQDKQFRTVVCSASSEQKKATENGRVRRRETRRWRINKMEDSVEHMRTHHVKKPSDLCAADLSDRGLTTAMQWEKFHQFTCLAYINASENNLPLEAFRTFPALRELDLSMNGIHRITIVPGEFPQLEVLDLSYNSLFPGDIRQLGVLPRLRVLCLTGNRLTHLPPDLTAPPTKDGEILMFPSLEVMMLDDNLLSHPDVFMSLAGLQGLKLLNLDKNHISAVPFLSVSCSSISETVPGGVMEGQGQVTEGDVERSQAAEDTVDYVVLCSTRDPDRTEVIFPSPRSPLPSDRALKPPNITIHPSALTPPESASPPLPSLRTLSLADNKIRYEEDVLPVALFASLQELIINGNPLTTLRKGDPPLLRSFLQHRLGINVIRKKSPGFHKPPLIIPRKEERKVTTHVPKIPKQPLMLESLLPCFLRLPHPESDVTESVMSSSPLPPIRTSSEGGKDTPPRSQESEEEMSFSSDPGVESVFMTQVDTIPDSPAESLHNPHPRTTPEERETATDKKTEPKIPKKFIGYEELYNVKTDPAFIEPVGIQNNVRALEYALRHLLVYRDYKPRLHSVQKPYVPGESKFGEVHPPPRKSKKDVVAEVLTSMKERRHLMEVPLDSALEEGRSRKQHKEAELLLKELQKKYQFFHQEAVKRAFEVEAGLRDTARQLLQAQRKAGDVHKRATTGKT
ncbi:X-ray radiation resistance-associated protein 1 isoform X2 [Bufo bufo]|uniref:X-ray radiation resistance-associated protein 1 isoform X2 n=1 Tax=Bufo bufo TaxID=8384 RepID=UPI001ABDC6E6|nr:X-ray radiation resistance-associated protein 1 isoform X2 [Bufo bufo]